MSKSHYYLFLSLMVMTMMVCASTQSNDLSQDAWNRFYTAFAGFIGGNPDGITFMTTPYAFTNVPTTGLFQLYTLCNSVPEWQFSYTGKGDVYGGYTEFVDSLYYEVNTQAYQKAAAQQIVVQNNQNSWSQCIEGLTASWTNFHNSQSSLPPQNQWSYTQWYDQIGKPRCQPQYDLWQSSVSQYNDLLKAALINGYDYVFQAQSGLQNPANYMSVYDGTNTRNVSICTTSPDLQSSYTNWLNGQLNPGSFSVSSLTSTYNKWQFSTESGGDLFFDPISIIAGGSYNRIEIDTSSDEFSMTVSWQGLQQLQFSRGSWYNGAIIQGHMDGPFSSSSAIGKGQVKLWGEDGMLGLVPSTAVVIYQPNIEISLSQSDYQKVKSSWTAESGGCIFIFCYETVNKGSSTSVKFNDNQFSFTLTDTSTIPKAIAIVNNVNTDPDSDLRSASKPLPQPSTSSSLSLDLKNFRSLSEKAVEFSVSQNEVTLRGDSSCFSGEIKITSSTAQPVAAAAVPASVAYTLAKVPCNDYNAFPTLTTTQMNCIIQSGLKSDTTSSLAWNFYYKTSSNKDLAHFTTGKAGGISAHFTCRAKSSDSGHHTGAVRTVPSQWLKQGCCNYSDSIKKDMNYIITTVLNCL